MTTRHLEHLDLPAPWEYQPETSVTLTEPGREDQDATVLGEAWHNPTCEVRLFRTLDRQPADRADLAGLYGIEVSRYCPYGQATQELDSHLAHARLRGWLS